MICLSILRLPSCLWCIVGVIRLAYLQKPFMCLRRGSDYVDPRLDLDGFSHIIASWIFEN